MKKENKTSQPQIRLKSFNALKMARMSYQIHLYHVGSCLQDLRRGKDSKDTCRQKYLMGSDRNSPLSCSSRNQSDSEDTGGGRK